jgi:hypothetical protein
MATAYRIHPAIGIARVGDSPTSFYLAPERIGSLPIACDQQGNAELGADGAEQEVSAFKDADGRILRQGARFQIFVYDDKSPEGRPLKIGDEIQDATSRGKLTNIHWYAYLANKKASWYEFKELEGEHGYGDRHPLRNASVTGSDRQSLIIDPGPQHVDTGKNRAAAFARGANPDQSQSFPPPLTPSSIESLGELKTDDSGRLIVLGGHGASGSYLTGLADPQISHYANNDGWFDDISDGPVTAILEYTDEADDESRLRQVDASSWVIVGSPGYAPELINVVTLDDVLYDLAVREFAYDTYLYGTQFGRRDVVDVSDPVALADWREQSNHWNPDYYPYFHRDIWPILLRAYNAQWLTNFLGISHLAHETGPGGDFEQDKVSQPPSDGLDPNRDMRMFVYEVLRKPGQENAFMNTTAQPSDKAYGKPLMPMLCGDNPLTNTLPAKFLTLTPTQVFLLHQWAIGKFINELSEDIPATDRGSAGTQLDRGVLGNTLGGSFCPGGEITWIIRNPAIYSEPYRIKWNPAFLPDAGSTRKSGTGEFFPPAALRFPGPGGTADDYSAGLEPGDLTKRSALPWQGDYNECSLQTIDVTYETWNKLYDTSGDPAVAAQNRRTNITLWWPAHRPMQVFRSTDYAQVDWARGIPQTKAGDLKMVTAWKSLGFVVKNPDPNQQPPPYVEITG